MESPKASLLRLPKLGTRGVARGPSAKTGAGRAEPRLVSSQKSASASAIETVADPAADIDVHISEMTWRIPMPVSVLEFASYSAIGCLLASSWPVSRNSDRIS